MRRHDTDIRGRIVLRQHLLGLSFDKAYLLGNAELAPQGLQAMQLFGFVVVMGVYAASDHQDKELRLLLPHQVRRFAGALVEVGRGRISIDGFEKLLERPPASAGPVAPAHGLCLMRVDYDTPLFGDGLVRSPAVC